MIKQLAVIVPVYGCSNSLDFLVESILSSTISLVDIELKQISFVNDCSPDDAWEIISRLAKTHSCVVGHNLGKNVGQHEAIRAGLELTSADLYIVMDCDLQHDPKFIESMVEELNRPINRTFYCQSGNDIVFTHAARKHGVIKNLFSKIFYGFLKFFGNDDHSAATSEIQNYTLITDRAKMHFLEDATRNAHFLFTLRSLGLNSGKIEIGHRERIEGTSSYTLGKLLSHALSGIFSDIRRFATTIVLIGAMSFLALFSLLIYLLYLNIVSQLAPGWLSLMLAVLVVITLLLMIGGLLLVALSYVLDEVRERPRVLLKESVGNEKK